MGKGLCGRDGCPVAILFKNHSPLGGLAAGRAAVAMLREKRESGRRKEYIDSLRHYVGRFLRGRIRVPIGAITAADIELYLRPYRGNSRATHLNRISALFAWAVRKGFAHQNPADRVLRPSLERSAPRILTPDEVDKLLEACPTVCKPGFAVCLFCGVRPTEARRLTWQDVNLETGVLTVGAAASKVRSRRLVPIPARALAVLKAHPMKFGNLSPSHSTCRRWNRKARTILGWWKADILRHTALTYWCKATQSPGRVAMMAGNSEKILMRHYVNGLASEADALRFFGGTPP